MFYSETILARKGALAKVWLAAHWEKKLSKAQFLQTNIQNSVGAIIDVGSAPMALRLSGQLLLGVVRIYSKKAKYLLDDCSEALMKIKMTFRPGAVNLTEEQAVAHVNAITLAENITEFDVLLPEPTLDLSAVWGQHDDLTFNDSRFMSRAQDITLQEQFRDDGMLNLHEDMSAAFGIDLNLETTTGDDGAWNLNLLDEADLTRLKEDSQIEIEVGRDALVKPLDNSMLQEDIMDLEKEMLRVDELGAAPAAEPAEFSFEAPQMMGDAVPEVTFGGDDFGDMGGFDLPPDMVAETTPKADRVQEDALLLQPAEEDMMFQVDAIAPKPKATRKRKLMTDSQTEMPYRNIMEHIKDTSDIIRPLTFVAPTWYISQMLEREKQGVHMLMDMASSDRLLPEVRRMCTFDVVETTEEQAVQDEAVETEERDPSILPEADVPEVVEPVEQETVDMGADFDFGGGFDMPAEQPLNEANMAVEEPAEPWEPALDQDPSMAEMMPEEAPVSPSTATLVPLEDELLTQTGVLFDKDDSGEEQNEYGYSKSTVKAIKLLQHSFESKSQLTFTELTQDANRTDAVRMFFELLVVKSKGMVNVEQEKPFGEIRVEAREGLYTESGVATQL